MLFEFVRFCLSNEITLNSILKHLHVIIIKYTSPQSEMFYNFTYSFSNEIYDSFIAEQCV